MRTVQVSKFDDPHEAALSVVAESYRLWLQVGLACRYCWARAMVCNLVPKTCVVLQYETRTDDITMIIVQFSGLEEPVPQLPRCAHVLCDGQAQACVAASHDRPRLQTCRPTGPGGTAFLDLERAASSRLQLGRPPSFRQRLGLAARVADIEAAGDTDQEVRPLCAGCWGSSSFGRQHQYVMCPRMQDMVGEDHAAPKPPELVAMLEEAVRR